LFNGGHEGHIPADGRYLIVLHTREEVFVALIAIDSGTVLDLKKACRVSKLRSERDRARHG
jgi:hypothetical protein